MKPLHQYEYGMSLFITPKEEVTVFVLVFLSVSTSSLSHCTSVSTKQIFKLFEARQLRFYLFTIQMGSYGRIIFNICTCWFLSRILYIISVEYFIKYGSEVLINTSMISILVRLVCLTV